MDPFTLIRDRIEREAADSSSAHCDSLMNACEFMLRHTTALLVALLPKTEEIEAWRYRSEFDLLRSSGIGEWSSHLNDLVVGPYSHSLRAELQDTEHEGCIEELTRATKSAADHWMISVVKAIRSALKSLGEVPSTTEKVRLIEFFNEFPRLRNKMDAHGAPTSNTKAEIAKLLSPAVFQLFENFRILKIPFVRVDVQEGNRAPRIIDVVGESSQDDKNQIADDL